MQSEVCARRAAATSYRLCSDATKPSKNMSINAGGDNEAHTRAAQRSVLSPSRTRCNNSAGALNPNAERTHSVSHRRMAESALATFVIFLFRCFVELMRLTLDFVCLLLLLGAHDPAVQQQYRSRESRTGVSYPSGAAGMCWQVRSACRGAGHLSRKRSPRWTAGSRSIATAPRSSDSGSATLSASSSSSSPCALDCRRCT